jgi:hypothetical protein
VAIETRSDIIGRGGGVFRSQVPVVFFRISSSWNHFCRERSEIFITPALTLVLLFFPFESRPFGVLDGSVPCFFFFYLCVVRVILGRNMVHAGQPRYIAVRCCRSSGVGRPGPGPSLPSFMPPSDSCCCCCWRGGRGWETAACLAAIWEEYFDLILTKKIVCLSFMLFLEISFVAPPPWV